MHYAYKQFDTALRLLNGLLSLAGSPWFNLVVCGGASLLAAGLVLRNT